MLAGVSKQKFMLFMQHTFLLHQFRVILDSRERLLGRSGRVLGDQ